MENKCNKTPNNNSNNNNTNKYMDHVYCHTNQNKTSYNNISTTPGSVGGGGAAATPNADILALLKENKQLKAMLILHLDLIQEQSDQLMAKEKILITRNEELETLRTRNASLESQVKDLQKHLQQQIKRSGEISTLPPPPLAKIQCKTNQSLSTASLSSSSESCAKIISTTRTAKSNIIGECNGKLISKIVLQRVNMASGRGKSNQSPQSQTTDTENDEEGDEDGDDEEREEAEDEEVEGDDEGLEDDEENDEDHVEENLEPDVEHTENAITVGGNEEIENSRDFIDEKSNTQQVTDDFYDTGNTTEDSNEVLAVQSKRLRLRQAAKQSLSLPRGAKPSISPASTTTNDGQTAFKAVTTSSTTIHVSKQPPTPSRGKQMTIMRWHAPDYNTDESVSCDSNVDVEKRSTSTTSSPMKSSLHVNEKKRSHDNSTQAHHKTKMRRCNYISTPQLYSTREWEDEAFRCDYDCEFLKAEAKLLNAENPKLEIPKWTEHELTPSYCIEGTEDLSDETFLKRHAKLEVDEKRRKKWDVQQIREQRRIERLKRRHCKDEIQATQDSPSLQTFYPTTENLQTVCFVNDLPVQAFGEMIPKLTSTIGLGLNAERKGFQLPWLDKELSQYINDNNKQPTVCTINLRESTTSHQIQQQMLNSSFIYLKKRRRQQSSSFSNLYHTSRQRYQTSKLINITSSPNTNSNITNNIIPSTTPTTTYTQTFLNIVKTVTTPSTSASLATSSNQLAGRFNNSNNSNISS